MTVPGNSLGFKAPVEYWTDQQQSAPHPMKDGTDIRLHGFDRQNIGNNESWFWFTAPELNNVVMRVRRLEERWVAWTLMDGEPVAAQYGWTKVKFTRFGVPVGYDYISLHGYKIKNCKIDYDDPSHLTLTPGTHPWELKRGMLIDPLCSCGPKPTCAPVENNVECFDFVHSLLTSRMVRSRTYKKYIDALAASPYGFSHLSQEFTIEGLTNASCTTLPAMLPDNLTEPLGACTDILLYDIFQREAAYLAEDGQWKGTATNSWQMKVVLESPRLRWLQCMQGQIQDRLADQSGEHVAGKFKGLHKEMDNMWNELTKKMDKPKDADETINSSVLMSAHMLITGMICLWLILRDCVCWCCRYLWCSKRTSEKHRSREMVETSRGGQQLAAPLELNDF